ncbi:cellulase family glycosylhydrolase [Synoicihabitans lomoniglobus]|uniref:Cellulase family glycosylhydrolase n=1 Tax=Synoicihabitans lomoniglobus TaxID=2909285 RepID=A0AAF0CRA4_9BACT|nr:cellulase family glycosylhydrolase [Opitutaceae bacterium LMO-M01]
MAGLLFFSGGVGMAAETTFSDGRSALETETKLSLISVEGNRFVNEAGETVVLRGLALSDPGELLDRGQWNRGYFEQAASWNANVVRVMVQPDRWHRWGEERFLQFIDEAVQWSGELGMYVIIDWHTIGNVLTGVYHRPEYITSKDETFRFWNTIAQRYRNNPTVVAYELYNEPTNRGGAFGRLPWSDYKVFVEDLIYMIHHIDPTAIALVAGFNWGYDLRHVRDEPIEAPNVAYVTHPYPMKSADWEHDWEAIWGFVAERHPIVATEFGYMSAEERGSHNPVIGDEVYGEAIINFFEKRGISWTPWVFDTIWTPNLLLDWDFTPSNQGRFFKAKLQELNP